MLQDLRRAFVDDDRNSLQRIIGNINPTEITNAVRMLEGNKDFVEDSLFCVFFIYIQIGMDLGEKDCLYKILFLLYFIKGIYY